MARVRRLLRSLIEKKVMKWWLAVIKMNSHDQKTHFRSGRRANLQKAFLSVPSPLGESSTALTIVITNCKDFMSYHSLTCGQLYANKYLCNTYFDLIILFSLLTWRRPLTVDERLIWALLLGNSAPRLDCRYIMGAWREEKFINDSLFMRIWEDARGYSISLTMMSRYCSISISTSYSRSWLSWIIYLVNRNKISMPSYWSGNN